jgi:hypothetical protein
MSYLAVGLDTTLIIRRSNAAKLTQIAQMDSEHIAQMTELHSTIVDAAKL